MGKESKISNDTIAKERKLMENSRITIIRILDLTTISIVGLAQLESSEILENSV